MISPHTFPVRGRLWAPLTLLLHLQVRTSRRSVTGRFYTQLGGSNHLPALQKMTDHLSEEETQLELQKGRLVQVPQSDWRAVQRTWHWQQQEHQHRCPAADWLHTSGSKSGHPQMQKKGLQALLEQPPPVSPRPTRRSQNTIQAAPFTRAHHPLQQGKDCFRQRKDQGSPQVKQEKTGSLNMEKDKEALESDKGPEWQPATCPKSSPFEGRYPDLHRQESSLPACR